MEPDKTNKHFELAVQFVNQTAQHIFLTGKAGTGKTTFLKYIKETTHKNMAVVAPTGVAAINAGGTTIHSLFQLPFGSFVPLNSSLSESLTGNFYNKSNLLYHLRLSNEKKSLIQALDLLIIDEVSMVRADVLDAIDAVLRHVRRKYNLPFGGVQMLYIGDLSQLPPVVRDHEWKVLKDYYRSQFFFDAQVLQHSPPLYLELKKIYRQSDRDFIEVLNNIRNNQVQDRDLELLHQYYKPGFKPEKNGEYITLTTHNSKADVINQKELRKLDTTMHAFKAQIDGEFNENSYPAESLLQLKEGAQIMFIKNDTGEERRYYNGKIGTIKKIKGEEIYVTFPDETTELKVEKEIWKNVKYNYNKEEDKVYEEEIGNFNQFPIRLAWAITIHKSQGLTFKKAIIDAGASFAPGQVYVALSRLTSLEGLVLYSKINKQCISTDELANEFSSTELAENTLEEKLKHYQKEYIHNLLVEVFNWQPLITTFSNFKVSLDTRRIPLLDEAKAMAEVLHEKVLAQQKIAENFSKKLQQMLLAVDQNGYSYIDERVQAAGKYFKDALYNDFFSIIEQHHEAVKKKPKVKKYLKDIQDLAATCKVKRLDLRKAMEITAGLEKGINPNILFKTIGKEDGKAADKFKLKTLPKQTKAPKGESHRISLSMFESGKSIQEIAQERNLAIGTIEGHLVSFIPSGKINIHELVSQEKMNNIEAVINQFTEATSSEIKAKLGDEYTYGEIRAVISFMKTLKEV